MLAALGAEAAAEGALVERPEPVLLEDPPAPELKLQRRIVELLSGLLVELERARGSLGRERAR